MDIRLCPNGHENPGTGRFCGVCGASMDVLEPVSENSSVEETSAVEAESVETVNPESTPASELSSTEPKNPVNVRKWLTIAGAAVVGLLIVGGGAYFLTTTPVADVVGMSERQALAALNDQGLEASVRDQAFSETVPKDSIASQDPAPGSRLGSGSQVTLILSRGPARTVPGVEGEPAARARSSVEAASLKASQVSEPSETVPEGIVISQSPSAGSELEDGDSVSLVVSSGPPRTTFTYINDVSSTVTQIRTADCRLAITLTNLAYPAPVVQNQNKQEISSISGRWRAHIMNGTYYPCYAIAEFPNTPTNEDEYRVVYLPSKAETNRSRWFKRSEMEAADWTLVD